METRDLINRAIGDTPVNSTAKDMIKPRDATPQQKLQHCWHEDLAWWGPDGIEATYMIDRHQRPFCTPLKDRQLNGQIAKLAGGNCGDFFDWPNLAVTPHRRRCGPARKGTQTADMRVIYVYRRYGDALA